jgi:hypothetical protein
MPGVRQLLGGVRQLRLEERALFFLFGDGSANGIRFTLPGIGNGTLVSIVKE